MWTEKQLQQKQKQGKIKGYNISPVNKTTKVVKTNSEYSKEKEWLSWNLMYWANEKALELVTEHKFHEKRKWLFDWAFPAVKIAIEYEGLMSKKSRHTTIKGYTGDTEKYNSAQAKGWRVIRLTALNYKTVLQTLNEYDP
jgi:hypothetical protein